MDAALGKLVTEMGLKQAGSIQCLCWALLWGKTTGNSINHARNKIRKMQLTSITSLDIFLLAYYGPLFCVIALLNALSDRGSSDSNFRQLYPWRHSLAAPGAQYCPPRTCMRHFEYRNCLGRNRSSTQQHVFFMF